MSEYLIPTNLRLAAANPEDIYVAGITSQNSPPDGRTESLDEVSRGREPQ